MKILVVLAFFRLLDGSVLQAHRVVLSACSDYFRAMFTDPMRERTQEEIQLSGVQAQGLELVLDYIYTSKLSLTLANVQTVLDTATHLQVLQVYILIFFHIILIILKYLCTRYLFLLKKVFKYILIIFHF